MKTTPVRFYFQRARIFGWLIVLCIIGYTLFSIFAPYFKQWRRISIYLLKAITKEQKCSDTSFLLWHWHLPLFIYYKYSINNPVSFFSFKSQRCEDCMPFANLLLLKSINLSFVFFKIYNHAVLSACLCVVWLIGGCVFKSTKSGLASTGNLSIRLAKIEAGKLR